MTGVQTCALPILSNSHLDALEEETIFILREVAAAFERPALLFSGGKDSLVMLKCAEKAFGAGRLPYPLLMIDTGHNFPEVTDFRDQRAQELGAELIVRSVEDSMRRGTVRLAHPGESRNVHQSVTLLEAIEEFRFDVRHVPGKRNPADSLTRQEPTRSVPSVRSAAARPAGGAFLIRCGLLYRRGQGEADRLCIPNGGGLRQRILRECHDTPLGGHFGRHKTASLTRMLTFWPGQTRDVGEYVRSCDTCQRTKAEHVGPRVSLHPLPLPTRRGGIIGVDWLMGLPRTAAG